MADFNSSIVTQPFNISVVTSNETDQLKKLIAPSWVSTPNVRGTWDILQSCILTLIACIYTALHLDVPKKTTWQYLLWEKSKWVAVTLFAPEIAVFTAASQLRYAWNLKSTLRKIQKEKQKSNWTRNADFEINLRYAFFLIMGGVRFDVHNILSLSDLDLFERENFENAGQGRRSVRPGPAAIILLAERGHWIHIRKQDIDDKSKAGTVQKGLVLLQVLWTVTQAIGRHLSGLPLSLLEIHTIVHVICAIFLYACWFEKPLDIQEAVLVQTEGFRCEIAAMLQQQYYRSISSKLALFPPKQQENQPPPVDADGSPMRWIDPQQDMEMYEGDVLPSGIGLSKAKVCEDECSNSFYLHYYAHPSSMSIRLEPEFSRRWDAIFAIFPFENREQLAQDPGRILLPLDDENHEPQSGNLSPRPLFLPVLEEFEPRRVADWEKPFWEGRSILHLDDTDQSVARKHRTWTESITEPHITFLSWRFFVLAGVLSGIYGGVHLAIWGKTFPTYVEELMWKVSCILIMCWIPSMPIVHVIVHPFNKICFEACESCYDSCCDSQGALMSGLYFIPSLLYLAARVFIIAESFLSLRQAPVRTFLSPEWVELFPHF